MSKRKPGAEPRPEVSRRSFIKGVGAGGTGTTLLASQALAAEQTVDPNLGRVDGPGAVPVTLNVNGETIEMNVEPRETLLDALRQGKTPDNEYVDLTGNKRVCDRATCGACSMLLDGEMIYGCSVLAVEAQGAAITTIEGLGTPESLSSVQEAFIEHDATMCGFCTPGMVIAVTTLLQNNSSPTHEQIQKALDGNICRCGTYAKIFQATDAVAAKMRGART